MPTVAVQYETVIGLEVHAHVLTRSKMFCSCPIPSLDSSPNSNACPVCLGMPGVLPVINRRGGGKPPPHRHPPPPPRSPGPTRANMEEGDMRCEPNVSVRPMGQAELGAKVELKNINSFRHVYDAILFEVERQI